MSGVNQITGLASGMDTAALVDSLMAFERRPAILLEARKAQVQLRLAAFSAMEGALSGLKSHLSSLRRPSDFKLMRGTVSHFDLMGISVSQNATQGTYNLTVKQLAQSHQITSLGYADDDVSLGTGTVTISLGGQEEISVTLDDGNNSLSNLVDAINEAGADVSASLVNLGSGDTPYQLILTGSKTGVDELITITDTLTGGAGLILGEVGPVVPGIQTGSSTVTSGGHYTGNTSAEYSFTVGTGGVVGSDEIIIDWTNDQGDSGQIVLDSNYNGEDVTVFGSMTLSFGAGDLMDGDTWTVGSEASTIQAAQDSLIAFGSTDPIDIYNSTNSINNLISGVTLDLNKADVDEMITVKVERDINSIMGRLSGFVDEYNKVIGYFNQSLSYDPGSEVAGVLLGDRTAMRLDSQLRNSLMTTMQGLSGDLSILSQIGIGTSMGDSLSPDGTLAIDESILRAALEDDLEGVISLLGSTGSASDDEIVFLNAGTNVVANSGINPYEVHITQAAAHGNYVGAGITTPSLGSPMIIGDSNHYMKLKVDGVVSETMRLEHGNYQSGEELATAIQQLVNSDDKIGEKNVTVSWVDDGGGMGHLEFTSGTYGINSKITMEEVAPSAYADLGLDAGTVNEGLDVEGFFMVNGQVEEASGSGRILTGNEENGSTKSLSVEVRLTAASLASQGELQGSVSIWSGITNSLHSTIEGFLDSVDGVLTLRQEGMRDTITDFGEQIDAIDDRLEIRRARYLKEFLRMEQLMSEMNSSLNTFNMMIANVPGIGSSGSS